MQTRITSNETYTGIFTSKNSTSIFSPIKTRTTAIPCCRYRNLFTAPFSRKNRERSPSTAKILLVNTRSGSAVTAKIAGIESVANTTSAPSTRIIASAGKYTLELAGAAAFLTYVIAIPVGVAAARRRNSPLDHGAMMMAVLFMGIPNFFLAVILINIFSIRLGWLPAAGSGGIKYLILPAVTLAAESVAINLRMVRSSVLEQLGRDYVRTLRAKGLGERQVVNVHAFRNALPPIFALAGITARNLFAYTMIVEVIFRWPGLGYQLVNAIEQRDYTLAQVLALMLTALVIVFNFFADVGQRYADPRTRESGGAA